MILAHNCFPQEWIGKKPVKVSDGAYYIGNDSTKLIIMPSGYGKGVYATWLSNGVLRIDTDINGTKLFFVGSQRFFPAYNDEPEPHETIRYKEAVKECQHMREEEARRNNSRQHTNDKSDGSHPKVNNESKKKGSSPNCVGFVM